MVSVLITRPHPWNVQLAATLEAEGYTPLDAPLLRAEPVVVPRPLVTSPLVLLTSRMALQNCAVRKSELADLLPRSCYCVGDKTAEEARAFGFTDVHSAQGDAKELAQLVLAQGPLNPILHLCGEEPSLEPKASLTAAGRAFHRWPIYRIVETSGLAPEVETALKERQIAAALFYSPRTARVFVRHIQEKGLQSCCQSLIGIGLSKAVADVLSDLVFKRVVCAEAPSEAALLDSLRTHCPL